MVSGKSGIVLEWTGLLKIIGFAFSIGLFTMLRVRLEDKRWMLKRSFLIKRWIFMPGYLCLLLMFIAFYGFPGMDGGFLLLGTAAFLVIYSVVSVFVWIRYRLKKQEYSALLERYKKSLGQ